MADEAGDKTLDATPHRRQQARDEGHVVHSQDLTSAALLLGALLVLSYGGAGLLDYLARTLTTHLGGEAWLQSNPQLLIAWWWQHLAELARSLLPLLGAVMLMALTLHLAQIGFLFLPHKVLPDFSRLDPLAGLARLASLANLMKLALGVLKVLLVGAVGLYCLYRERDVILSLVGLEIPQLAALTWSLSLSTAFKVGGVLLLLAVLDFAWQRWKYEQDLRMTPQEMREEMRNLQGDPQVISRRKAVQRQLALSRLSSAVPKAQVVITNPTELAIAIQYEPETMNAPVVVAKGAGVIAQRIRRLALEHGIPIIEKKPLAQALYKEVDLNRPIPESLYAGVAEVLAYVYQLQGKPLPGAG